MSRSRVDARWTAPSALVAALRALPLTFAVACAMSLPEPLPQRALVRDAARVVDVRSSVGWLVDEAELQAALPHTMQAVCQVRPVDRAAALAWLDGQIAANGGDVVAVWRAKGKKLGAVEDLLLLTRTRLLLGRGDEWARLGRCPFWLEPAPAFAGVHTQGGRFILTLEGGGRVLQEFALGRVRYGGGGAGRLLVGYGISEAWALSAGLEFGGSARFTNLQLGEQREFPDLVGLAAAPVLLRWQLGLTVHAELESGPIAYIDYARADAETGRVSLQYDLGWRVGVALGGTYLRLEQGAIPKFSVGVTVDRVPAVDGKPALTQVGVGVRTGIDLSRWTRF